MDDITKKYIDGQMSALGATLTKAIETGHAGASEERRLLAAAAEESARRRHGETMRKFQHVIEEAERIGAAAARDRRVGELETEVTELRDRLDSIEQRLPPRPPRPPVG